MELYPLLSLSELLWNCLVYLTPEELIPLLDPAYRNQWKANSHQSEPTSKNRARKSEALRKLLGLGDRQTTTTIQQVENTLLTQAMSVGPKKSPPGLGNWDNSCYQNSIIQGLSSLSSLPGYLGQCLLDEEEEPLTRIALRDLLESLNSSSNAGKLLWTPSALKNMSSWQQQDAQEYFSKILDEVDKEVSRSVVNTSKPGLPALVGLERRADITSADESKAKSSVQGLPDELKALISRNPLEGLLAQRVGCLQCGYVEGLSLIPFNCLTVPLGRQWIYDLRTCLDDFTSLEPINGVECNKCTLLRAKQQLEVILQKVKSATNREMSLTLVPDDLKKRFEDKLGLVVEALDDEDFSDAALKRCDLSGKDRISTTKSRQAVIARAPKSLVIHINRSVFDEMTGAQWKNPASVRFPEILDLSSWCLGSDFSRGEGATWVERWRLDPAVPMLPLDIHEPLVELQKMYQLRAVITHYGRHENGHYYCYRQYPAQEPEDGKFEQSERPWWRLSDEDVSEVTKETVLSQGGAFMLFYEMIEITETPKAAIYPEAEVQSVVPCEVHINPEDDEADDAVLMLVPPGSGAGEQEQHDSAAEAIPPSIMLDEHAESLDPEKAVETPTKVSPPLDSEPPEPAPSAANLNDTDIQPSPPLESGEAEVESHSSLGSSIEPYLPDPNDSAIREEVVEVKRHITPTMRTATPRGGKGSTGRRSSGMGQVSSMISAN